tara:strand:+ start:2086 stop:2409 length:324 start_codon:yes stop_codon:yes gene_type:complete
MRKMEKHEKETNLVFICHNCGPAVRVLSEQWTEHIDGPHTIDVIQHEKEVAMLISSIEIHPRGKGKQISFDFCAECGDLIPPPISIDDLHLVCDTCLSPAKERSHHE